jgi:hypothetical protein
LPSSIFCKDIGVRTVEAGEENYKKAIELFRTNFQKLSVCDAATVVISSGFGITTLASYDERSFAGLIKEILGVSYYESLNEKDKTALGKRLRRD